MRKLMQSALSQFGYQLVYYGKGNRAPPGILSAFFSAVKGLGFAPAHILDVGANRGQWTRSALRHFPSPPCHYTLIEPQQRLRPGIQDLLNAGHGIEWINAGAGDRACRMTFHVPAADTSASFSEAMAGMQAGGSGMTCLEVDVVTLNDVVAASAFGIPQMVKIDAEGFDLKVLEGASDLFGKTELFLVEVSLFDSKSDSTLTRVVRRMEEAGYVPLDITDLNRCARSGVLWLCELVFARRDGELLARIPPYVSSFVPDA